MAKRKTESDNGLKRISDSRIITRVFVAGVETLDDKTRSIMATLSTETPVRTYDWESGQYINEILLADSFEVADQVPLLDSHARWSVKDQLGSIREMKTEALKFVGRVYFGPTQAALDAFAMVKERHLTDLSIGYITAQAVIVNEGQEYKHTDGRTFKGPVKLSLKTIVKEGSITPIGADEMAKFRDANVDPDEARMILLEKENRDLKEKLESAHKTIYLLNL